MYRDEAKDIGRGDLIIESQLFAKIVFLSNDETMEYSSIGVFDDWSCRLCQ